MHCSKQNTKTNMPPLMNCLFLEFTNINIFWTGGVTEATETEVADEGASRDFIIFSECDGDSGSVLSREVKA